MTNVMNLKKAIIITNGPSFNKFIEFIKNNKNLDWREYCIITVNRWARLFNMYYLPLPNIVIIGKNSLPENITFLKNVPTIQFFGVEPCEKIRFQNYTPLTFGLKKSYGVDINHISSLWWSGIYCLQWAIQREFEKIYIFGMSCNNKPDFKDSFIRSPIPSDNMGRVNKYIKELNKIPELNKILFFEEDSDHLFRHNLSLQTPSWDLQNNNVDITKKT